MRDNHVLGKFNIDASPLVDVRGEELKAAYQRIDELETRVKRLEADLLECREYLEDAVDVVDGDYGEPHPNRAMQLVTMIDETLAVKFFEPFPAESGA